MNSRFQKKIGALGEPNQIVIVCDQNKWDGPLGDSLVYHFSSVFPVLPRPEPLFDLKHFNGEELTADKLRRELRTYLILANINDTASVATKLAIDKLGRVKIDEIKARSEPQLSLFKNIWADGQIVFFLLAGSMDDLETAVGKSFKQIASKVHAHDKKLVDAYTYLNGESHPMRKMLDSAYNIHSKIPQGFKKALSNDKVIWLRKDDGTSTLNLIFQEHPYRSKEQFSVSYIKELRDLIGRKYVSSDADSTYMITNDIDLPMYAYERRINENYTIEARGIWEMENDFMGGPFISFLIHNEKRQQLLFVDGFILAPGSSKRKMVQELAHIVESIQFK